MGTVWTKLTHSFAGHEHQNTIIHEHTEQTNSTTANSTTSTVNVSKTLTSEEKTEVVFQKLKKARKPKTQEDLDRLKKEAEIRSNPDWLFNILFDDAKLSQYYGDNSMAEIKIKFVIVDMDWTFNLFGLGKIDFSALKRFAKNVKPEVEYGVVHTAIVVGPFVIHWLNDGLVTVNQIKSHNCVAVVDLTTIQRQNIHVLHKVCEIIEQWNTTKEYNNGTNNCQTFCKEFIKSLNEKAGTNITLQFSGALEEYFKDLKRNGKPSKSFRNPETGEIKSFEDHESLDDYVHSLPKDFHIKYPQEFALLKAYDRSFWINHYHQRSMDVKDWKKQFVPSSQGCPFKDPVCTDSFPVLNRAGLDKAVVI